MLQINLSAFNPPEPWGPGASVVKASRSIPPMIYTRSQCLPGVAGDCVCFVREAYRLAGYSASDRGVMLCSGFGGSQLTDRLESEGFVCHSDPIPGAIVVYTWSFQPQHMGIITEVCYDSGNFSFIHLCASLGHITEHPSTGHWEQRFHSIWLPPTWLDDLPQKQKDLPPPLPRLSLPLSQGPLHVTLPALPPG